MKTQEEIEQLALQRFPIEMVAIFTVRDKVDKNKERRKIFIETYTQCQEDMADISKVTRFEVIDTNGRVYQKWNCNVELSYQDDDRTLKVFIKPLNKQE